MFKKTIAIITVALILFTSCSKATPRDNAEVAEEFIRLVLTMPNERIVSVAIRYTPELWFERLHAVRPKWGIYTFFPKEFDNSLLSAIKFMCGDYITPDLLAGERMGGSFYLSIINFHLYATWDGYTCTVESVELEETGERQYRYAATVITSYSDEPIVFRGTIRFDDDGLICYMILHEPIYIASTENIF